MLCQMIHGLVRRYISSDVSSVHCAFVQHTDDCVTTELISLFHIDLFVHLLSLLTFHDKRSDIRQ